MRISEITIKPKQPIKPLAPIKPIAPLTPEKSRINVLKTQKDRADAALKNEKQAQQRTKAVAGIQKAQQTLAKINQG